MKFADEEILLYDLSNRPASFDIVTCLATAIALGAKHVRFVLNNGWKRKNYTEKQAVERFISIVEPAVSLYGIDYSVGDRRGFECSHVLIAAVETYKRFGRIGKINVECIPQDYVTITLRKSRSPERDSNEAEWLRFAKRCPYEAVILRDWDQQQTGLHERMALYAGAKMNFMVINGPLTLCIHSDAPYLSMRTIGGVNSGSTSPQQIYGLTGITPGFQFPWAHSMQTLSYLDDTCENIEAEWQRMQEKEKKVA